ncbi:MAG: fold metallo-hydrolase [Schumannella sp.]|nr:fold metallo-hydrolase [Schumannella sp.]
MYAEKNAGSEITFTFLGGPSGVLEYGGLRFLLDPTFDEPQTYPDDDGGTPLVKTQGPALQPEDIGQIDVVLASHHEHADNLDTRGAEFAMTAPLVLSTPKAGDDLGTPWAGMADWSQRSVGLVDITAVPALHGPPGVEEALGPVVGFILRAPALPTVYVSGDNASLEKVREIADRFAPIGVAILFAGAARVPEIDAALTLTSTDAVEAARILRAGQVVGVHTEDWQHFSQTRADLEAAFAELPGVLVDTPRGERILLGG